MVEPEHLTHFWGPNSVIHDVIHGLDLTEPLGIGPRVPEQRRRIVLQGINAEDS
jgi:hypothetical protein